MGLRGFKKLPDPIANAPDLFPWLVAYYNAFEELTSDRPIDTMSGSVGFIPWSAIDRYARRHTYLGSDFGTTLHYIRVLDRKYLALVRESQPKEKPGKPGSKPSASPPVKRMPRRR